jgi:hypothetical protein
MNSSSKSIREVLLLPLLIVSTIVVYWQVKDHDFINYDDNEYVTSNEQVQKGLTRESIVWAFTAVHSSNWHPLTWLSHMLDVELFGMDPKGHHLMNVFFHVVNTVLLFLVLRRMTNAVWRSFFVAALFALHPLHVESVAWVSERKDVLSTMLWILTIWLYVRYTEEQTAWRYLAVATSLALGLLAKPMLVTLPFVLLLLDYWPLRRIRFGKTEEGKPKKTGPSPVGREGWLNLLRLLREKIPLLVLAAASSVVTFVAQQTSGSVTTLEGLSLFARLSNAAVAYVEYIRKMFWPSELVVFYPHPGKMLPLWEVVGAIVLLLFITGLVVRSFRTRPYLLTGWLWYLGTLVPVIGIVQVGMQSMADRYTYVPFIGLFLMIAWILPDVLSSWRYRKIVLASAATAVIIVLTSLTWKQLPYWKNSITLFEHALRHSERNFVAHYNLGAALHKEGKEMEALDHYREALKISPAYVDALNNLGVALTEEGKLDEAASYYLAALRIRPRDGDLHNNLGAVYAQQGKMAEAFAQFSEAVRYLPGDSLARANYERARALLERDRSK